MPPDPIPLIPDEAVEALGPAWRADAAVVLGSGLGGAARAVEEAGAVPYEAVPGLGPCSVPGHEGRLVRGTLAGLRVLVFQGRRHLYEGVPMAEAALPVRVAAGLGARLVVLFSAVGGVDPGLDVGDWVLVTDHLNWMGRNPLEGVRTEAGPPFLDLTGLYRADLLGPVAERAEARGLRVGGGVYAAFAGPTYETPAEVRWARAAGAAVVGMSVVPEAVWARLLGLDVAAWCRVTNPAAGVSMGPLNHRHVLKAAEQGSDQAAVLLAETLRAWASAPSPAGRPGNEPWSAWR